MEIKLRKNEFETLKKQGLPDRINPFLYNDTLKHINKLNVLNNRYQPHFFAGA